MRFSKIYWVLSVVMMSLGGYAQSISSEMVEFQMLKAPKTPIDEANRQFRVVVTSPYNLKAEDVDAQSKLDFQAEQKNYAKVLAESEKAFQEMTKNHDIEVAKAKEKFELESAEFKAFHVGASDNDRAK